MDSVKKPKGGVASCQQYLKIAEIRDNTVVLKDGSIRAVIKVNSINFDLKSEEEQNGIIYSYQQFLNTLEFPIQIIIKSKKLDIDSYMENMRKIYAQQTSELLRKLTANYVEYIARLIEISDIMQKEFYVVVPVDPFISAKALNPLQKFFHALNPADNTQNVKKRREEFDSMSKKLGQRVQSVIGGFSNMGIKAEKLDTYQLIELYYKSYNPDLTESQKPKNLQDIDIDIESSKQDDKQKQEQ